MRLAIWTYTAAVVFASMATASLGGMFGNIYHYRLGDKPLPPITQVVVGFNLWALAIPLPFLFAATWLSRRDIITPNGYFAFAGVSTLAIAFLFTFTAIALTTPFVSIMQR